MPCRSVSSDVPAATAWSADVCRLEAIGSSVIRRFAPRPVEHLRRQRLAGELLDHRVRQRSWPRRGSPRSTRTSRTRPRGASSRCRGTCDRYSVATIRWVVTKSPSGHRSFSSTQHVRAGVDTRRDAHGSGSHAPSTWPALNRSSVCEFSCGDDGHVARAAGQRVSRPSSASQARSATSWVLPSCGVASVLALEVVGGVDAVADDELRAAGGRAGDDPDGLAVRLRERVDGRVRADVRGVDAPHRRAPRRRPGRR